MSKLRFLDHYNIKLNKCTIVISRCGVVNDSSHNPHTQLKMITITTPDSQGHTHNKNCMHVSDATYVSMERSPITVHIPEMAENFGGEFILADWRFESNPPIFFRQNLCNHIVFRYI